jgi:hypothetical protein
MEKTVVYTTKFDCYRCKAPVTIRLLSDDSNFQITDRVKEEVDYWGKHYHWVDNHQICAICGKLVVGGSGELDLIQTELMLRDNIHPLYLEWELNPDRGLLTVHKACSKKMFAEVKE